ncbi:MAG TPA: hypothetical protein VG897_18445, partial [Terriglobales bacterium]|nr:hypothetical protein [Terriglobales bacterium]
DHNTGDISHLVVKEEHGRRGLVPVNMVRPVIENDRDLQTELSREDMDHLPAFDDRMLRHDQEWKHYMQLHRQTLKDRNKKAQEEYERGWEDNPVEHRTDDVAHLITPIDVEPEPSNVTLIDRGRRRDDYVPDLTPQRLAPIFTNTEETPDKLNMVPNAGQSRGPAAEYQTAGLGVKWNGYQEMVRRELPRLRGACETCERERRRVA